MLTNVHSTEIDTVTFVPSQTYNFQNLFMPALKSRAGAMCTMALYLQHIQ
jgi:hypothetical protein